MNLFKTMAKNYLIIALMAAVFGLIVISYLLLSYRPVEATVDLLSTPQPAEPARLHEELTFKVAIAPVLSPLQGYEVYHGIADYLAQRAGLPLEIVSRDSCREINLLLARGNIDLAFICCGGYSSAPEAMDIIAAPVIGGKPSYHSLIIVPSESEARSLADLRGKRFAFVEPESNAGFWQAAQRVRELGGNFDTFFSQVSWTGAHDHSIRAVSQHMADGAAVSSLAYRIMLRQNPELAQHVRIIEQSPPFPSPPVAVRKSMPFPLRHKLAEALTGLAASAAGRKILAQLGVDGFLEASNRDYQGLLPPGEHP